MNLIAVDPGSAQSGYARFVGGVLAEHGKKPNEEILAWLRTFDVGGYGLALEMVASYGMPVGAEVFETCVWIGRFAQAWNGEYPSRRIYRKDVKMHLCQSMKANDSTIRQALIDRHGGKDAAIGKKARPGPLYGVKADAWQAVALGITAMEA